MIMGDRIGQAGRQGGRGGGVGVGVREGVVLEAGGEGLVVVRHLKAKCSTVLTLRGCTHVHGGEMRTTKLTRTGAVDLARTAARSHYLVDGSIYTTVFLSFFVAIVCSRKVLKISLAVLLRVIAFIDRSKLSR